MSFIYWIYLIFLVDVTSVFFLHLVDTRLFKKYIYKDIAKNKNAIRGSISSCEPSVLCCVSGEQLLIFFSFLYLYYYCFPPKWSGQTAGTAKSLRSLQVSRNKATQFRQKKWKKTRNVTALMSFTSRSWLRFWMFHWIFSDRCGVGKSPLTSYYHPISNFAQPFIDV